MTDIEKIEKYEVGVVAAGPIKFAVLQLKTIFSTWRYCRKNNIDCSRWYGVYKKGSEVVMAQTGCLPDSKDMAEAFVEKLNT